MPTADPGRAPFVSRFNDLPPDLLDAALTSGRDIRLGRAQRIDGWTPKRIRIFLGVLARCGVTAEAARAAGMSTKSAYALRNSPKGADFAEAWCAAQILGRRRKAARRMARVRDRVELIVRDGEIWAECRPFQSGRAMAALNRLDKMVGGNSVSDRLATAMAGELEAFIDVICAGDHRAFTPGDSTRWCDVTVIGLPRGRRFMCSR